MVSESTKLVIQLLKTFMSQNTSAVYAGVFVSDIYSVMGNNHGHLATMMSYSP